jgi:hypothetical protein
MMKGTYQVASPGSHLYDLKYPRKTQVKPGLQLQGVFLTMSYPWEIQVRPSYH